ncbi:MAG: hypothetical protein H7287_07755 [Thermoleophilia bacterium]|nr:hypothetical protein [Thermoleophilia bacterium]
MSSLPVGYVADTTLEAVLGRKLRRVRRCRRGDSGELCARASVVRVDRSAFTAGPLDYGILPPSSALLGHRALGSPAFTTVRPPGCASSDLGPVGVQLTFPTSAPPVQLQLPVRGDWFVANGGRSSAVNGHWDSPDHRGR